MGRIETFQEEAPCGHANAWIKILKVTLLCCLKSVSMQAWTEVYYWFNSSVRHSEGMKAKVKQFWQISCEAPEPGHSLCGAWCYHHGNQLTQCQSNNFVLRWINGRGGRGRESFRLNHRQASPQQKSNSMPRFPSKSLLTCLKKSWSVIYWISVK